MMLTAGYHDSRVRYWQPLRWVAKVRDMKTDNNVLLLKTNMAGHYGGQEDTHNMRTLQSLCLHY